MLQRRKRYKNRTILGYKTLALGLINMAEVSLTQRSLCDVKCSSALVCIVFSQNAFKALPLSHLGSKKGMNIILTGTLFLFLHAGDLHSCARRHYDIRLFVRLSAIPILVNAITQERLDGTSSDLVHMSATTRGRADWILVARGQKSRRL